MRAWAWPVLVALIAAPAMLWLSVGITRHALDIAAAREAAHYAAGVTPWHWPLKTPANVVAGHAFGHATLASSEHALAATSNDGSRYAIGLPMSRPADLERFPRLLLQATSTDGFHLRLSLGQNLHDDLLVSNDLVVAGGAQTVAINLLSLVWHDRNGATVVPARAAMLRLRIQQTAGSTVLLRDARLRSPATSRTVVTPLPDTRAARTPEALRAMLERLAQHTRADAVPVVLLNAHTAESLLRQRDHIRQWLPAAIVAADASWRGIHGATNTAPAWITWPGLIVYLGSVLILLWRPPRHPRWRASCEMVACTLPPLAWAMGLRAASTVPAAWGCGVVIGLLLACVLAWRQRPRVWRWADPAWQSWVWPALAIIAAMALLLGWQAAPALPSPQRLLTYLLWALLQQILMLVVVLPRLRQLAGSRAWAIVGTALLFALMHTPNGWLMQLTFVAELYWAWCYLRRPNLLPIALAHALSALLLIGAMQELPLRSLAVGARFLQ